MTTYDLHSCPPSMRIACELWICSSWRTELDILNIQSEQQQKRDDNLRLAKFHLCPPSVQTANLLFMTYGTQGIQHSISTAAIKRRQLSTRQSPFVSPCRSGELLANCEFALRGSDSFRSSEPKEINAINACNKWPVYSTNTRPIHINCNRASKKIHQEVYSNRFKNF